MQLIRFYKRLAVDGKSARMQQQKNLYYWESQSQQWAYSSTVTTSNSADQRVRNQFEYDSTGHLIGKFIEQFDDAGRLIEATQFLLTDLQLKPIFTEKYAYDSVDGSVVLHSMQRQEAGQWVVDFAYQVQIERVGHDRVIRTFEQFNTVSGNYEILKRDIEQYENQILLEIILQVNLNNQWLNSEAEAYDFDDQNRITDIYHVKWNGNNWVNDELLHINGWHDYSKMQATKYEIFGSQNNSWQLNGKVNFEYGAHGSQEIIEYKLENNAWIPTTKYIDQFNAQGLRNYSAIEAFENGKWEVFFAIRAEHHYSANGSIKESIHQYYEGSQFQNYLKEVYTESTALGNPTENIKGIKVFPNPSTSYLQIDLSSEGSQHFVQLTDDRGRLVLEQEIFSGNDKIDVSMLPAGLYILTCENKDGKFFQKVIKQ